MARSVDFTEGGFLALSPTSTNNADNNNGNSSSNQVLLLRSRFVVQDSRELYRARRARHVFEIQSAAEKAGSRDLRCTPEDLGTRTLYKKHLRQGLETAGKKFH